MKKLLLAVLGGTAVASLAFASAASLTVDGGVMQVGLDGDLTCTDEVKVKWVLETDTNTVSAARVSGIDADCVGADMFFRTNLMTQQVKVPITSAGEVRVNIPAQDATTLESVRIWIDG